MTCIWSILECAPRRSESHTFQFIVLLPFHPAILEPDFNLPLGEAESVRYLYSPPAREISIEMELFLQLERLVASVRGSSPFSIRSSHIWHKQGQRDNKQTSPPSHQTEMDKMSVTCCMLDCWLILDYVQGDVQFRLHCILWLYCCTIILHAVTSILHLTYTWVKLMVHQALRTVFVRQTLACYKTNMKTWRVNMHLNHASPKLYELLGYHQNNFILSCLNKT